jgi:hypothetical protein
MSNNDLLQFQLDAKRPIALDSADHVLPWGTRRDNSVNKGFTIRCSLALSQRQPNNPQPTVQQQFLASSRDSLWIRSASQRYRRPRTFRAV